MNNLLSVREAAERLGVSADTVYGLCSAGKIAHARVGLGRGKIKISEEALAAYLTAASPPPKGPPHVRAAPRRSVKLKHLRS